MVNVSLALLQNIGVDLPANTVLQAARHAVVQQRVRRAPPGRICQGVHVALPVQPDNMPMLLLTPAPPLIGSASQLSATEFWQFHTLQAQKV